MSSKDKGISEAQKSLHVFDTFMAPRFITVGVC
jgi:hypothetical protein